MKKILKITAVIGTAVGLAACVSNKDLGPKDRTLVEKESPVVFGYPGMEDGFRRIEASRSDDGVVKTVWAAYGPKRGAFPRMTILYRRIVQGGYYFPDTTMTKELGYFDIKKSEVGPEKRTRMPLGVAKYTEYEKYGGHCAFFYVKFGKSPDLGGTETVDAFFCDKDPLSEDQIKDVMGRVKIVNGGEIVQIPESEKKQHATKTGAADATTKDNVTNARYKASWEGLFKEKILRVYYEYLSAKNGTLKFYATDTGTCKGEFKLDAAIADIKVGKDTSGKWSIGCHKGQTAEGNLTVSRVSEEKTELTAEGKDKAGKVLKIQP